MIKLSMVFFSVCWFGTCPNNEYEATLLVTYIKSEDREVFKFLRGSFCWSAFPSQYPMMLRTYVARELICRKVNIQFKCHLCSMDLKIKMPLILTTFFLNSKYIHSCVPDQRFVSNLIISITLITIQILDIVFFFSLQNPTYVLKR